MYFYHEGYHGAYYAAALEDLTSGDRQIDHQAYEPIRIPAILNWLVIVTIALCIIFTTIHVLS